jgi:hypothetical protein
MNDFQAVKLLNTDTYTNKTDNCADNGNKRVDFGNRRVNGAPLYS